MLLKSRSSFSVIIPWYFWNNWQYFWEYSQHYLFLFFPLRLRSRSGWLLLKPNTFRLLHQAVAVSGENQSPGWELTCIKYISYSKTCQTINKPSVVTADRAMKRSFLTITATAFLLAEEADGLYWPHSLRWSFFDNCIFWVTRGFSCVSPRGWEACMCLKVKTERLVLWREDINSENQITPLLSRLTTTLVWRKRNVINRGFTRHIFTPFARQTEQMRETSAPHAQITFLLVMTPQLQTQSTCKQ